MERLRNSLVVVACLAIIAQSAVSTGFVGATVAFAGDNMQPLLAKITNTAEQPVPVTGDVQATVDGLTFEGGSLNVKATNLPTDTSGSLKVASQGIANVSVTNTAIPSQPTLATKREHLDSTWTDEPGWISTWPLSERINASSITVSMIGTAATVWYWQDAPEPGNLTMLLGSRTAPLTGVYSIPLPQRVAIDGFYVECYDAVGAKCEVNISVIGD